MITIQKKTSTFGIFEVLNPPNYRKMIPQSHFLSAPPPAAGVSAAMP